jgi:hypothetical protein
MWVRRRGSRRSNPPTASHAAEWAITKSCAHGREQIMALSIVAIGVFVLLVCLGERLRDWRPLLAEQFRKLRDIAPACLVQTA